MNLEDIIEDTTAVSDIGSERRFTILAITSTQFLNDCHKVLTDISLFDSSYVRTVMKWSLEYYHKYKQAINKHIVGVYEQQRHTLSDIQSKEIAEFLQSLSEEFEQAPLNNTKPDIDFLLHYLKTQQIKRHQKKVAKLMDTGKVLEAEAEIASFNSLKVAKSEAREITENYDRYDAKDKDPNFLFDLKGAWGEMWGSVKRAHVTMIGAVAKFGKSRTMIAFGCEGSRNGLNVFFANCEMTQQEVELLVDQEILKEGKYTGKATIPYFEPVGDKFKVSFDVIDKEAKTKDEIKYLWEAERKYNTPNNQIIIRTWAQNSARVSDIEAELQVLRETHNFVPDIIIVDYCDLLRPEKEDSTKDKKYQIMGSRRALKKLATDMNVHVQTATQIFESGETKGDREKDTDVNVLANITGTDGEKECGIVHMTCMANRNKYFNKKDDIIILTNHGIGQAHLDSKWAKDCIIDTNNLGENFKLFTEELDNYEIEDDFSDYFD